MRIRIYVVEWYADCKTAAEYCVRKANLSREMDKIVGPGNWYWGIQTFALNTPKCVYVEDKSDLLVLKLKGLFVDGEYPIVEEKLS